MNRLASAVLLLAVVGGTPARGEEPPPPPPPPPPVGSAATPGVLWIDAKAAEAFERARPTGGKPPTRSVVLTRREPPVGIEGAPGARQGDARAGTTAFVLTDGRVLVVRDGRSRILSHAGPRKDRDGPIRARRVAVLTDGRVVVQTSDGRLFLAGETELEPLRLRSQGQAHLVADAVRPVAWIGTEAGAVLRLDPTARTLDTAWPSGDAPVTALAAEDGRVLVGRGDGSIEIGSPPEPPRTVARFEGTVLAVALSGDVAAAADPLRTAVLRVRPEGAVLALLLDASFSRMTLLARGDGPPLLVTCRPKEANDVAGIDARSPDPDVALGHLRLSDTTSPAPGGPRPPWVLDRIAAIFPSADGRSVHLVVPEEGPERVVDVEVRPVASNGSR